MNIALGIKKVRMGFEKSRQLIRDFNNITVNATVGGKSCHFRSKGEYRLAQYLELIRRQNYIADWRYEVTRFVFKEETRGVKEWLVDFDVVMPNGRIEHYEYKGYPQSSDITKFRRLAKWYPDAHVTLVMSGKSKRHENRIRILTKYAARVVYSGQLFGPWIKAIDLN